MTVQGDTLPPVPQHTPPFRGKPEQFDIQWMQWFVALRSKLNVINGPVILPSSGGTGMSSYVIGDVLVATATQTLGVVSASTAGYLLTSNGPGTVPTYQPASGGVGFGVATQLPTYPLIY